MSAVLAAPLGPVPMPVGARAPMFELQAVSKSFENVAALQSVDLTLAMGERIGIVGHNGAGKSTLINILNGALRASGGRFLWRGDEVADAWGLAAARRAGVRCVFQELALVPNLSAIENLRLLHPSLKGWGWRRKAATLLARQLEEIFPGNGIDIGAEIGALPIGQRQMIEVARAFTQTEVPVRLVVLDEPTSSLTAQASVQLIDFLRRDRPHSPAIVLVSHKMKEVLGASHRIVAMKDGRKILDRPVDAVSPEKLMQAMGATESRKPAATARVVPLHRTGASLLPHAEASMSGLEVTLRAGEIVGFGGLAGHGQSQALVSLYQQRMAAKAALAFVAGDRQSDGIFTAWSIARNFSASALRQFAPRGVIGRAAERAAAREWCERLKVRCASIDDPITALSGGNQQKVLFARALATPASVVLMDDPTRGVDIATKQDMYRRIQDEAAEGRAFLWYSTEHEELRLCDRVYVFHEGRVVGVLGQQEFTEDAALAMTFGGTP